jgi:hypothetical protein
MKSDNLVLRCWCELAAGLTRAKCMAETIDLKKIKLREQIGR